MRTSAILAPLTALFLAPSAFAAPAESSAKHNATVGAASLYKCTLTAYWAVDIIIGSGGGRRGHGDADTHTYFTLDQEGQPQRKIFRNSIKMGWQTIPASETGTAMDVSYWSSFNIPSSWKACTVSYDFHEDKGRPMKGDCKGAGRVCAKCVMDFGC